MVWLVLNFLIDGFKVAFGGWVLIWVRDWVGVGGLYLEIELDVLEGLSCDEEGDELEEA